MIASMNRKYGDTYNYFDPTSGDNYNGKKIFDQLMKDIDNPNNKEKLELILNFATMIASMATRHYFQEDNNEGKKIFDQLMKDIDNPNNKEKLELISKFAPIIASMAEESDVYRHNHYGKDIFKKLMSLNTEKLKEINNSYNECKKGDDQIVCHHTIMMQTRRNA